MAHPPLQAGGSLRHQRCAIFSRQNCLIAGTRWAAIVDLPELPAAVFACGNAALAHALGQPRRAEEARAALDRAVAAAPHPAARRLLQRKRSAC